MRLSPEIREVFSNVLNALPLTSRTLAEHATNRGTAVSGSDISKLKGGDPIGDSKWEALLAVLEQESRRAGLFNELTEKLKLLRAARAAPTQRSSTTKQFTRNNGLVFHSLAEREDEVKQALAAIQWNFEVRHNSETLSKILSSDEPVFYIDKDYSNAGQGIQSLRDSLKTCLFSQSQATFLPMDDRWFANLLRWPRAQASKVLCLFPFFLTPRRRFLWGVIPYGQLTHIGLMTSSQHPLRPQDNDEVDFHWLAEAIEAINGFSEPRFFIEPGYVSEEIIVEAALMIQKANTRVSLAKSFRDLQPGFWEKNNSASEVEALLRDVGPSAMVAFDLSLKENIDTCLRAVGKREQYRLLRFRNDISVPVGVGFSLTALPLLLRTSEVYTDKTLYENLQIQAINFLEDRTLCSELRKIGIEISVKEVNNDYKE